MLCARWPGRREQISQLLGYLGEPLDHAAPVFVHGPPVTGKTSIVRDAFVTLGRPFAYTSLVDSHGPRLLLENREAAKHTRTRHAQQHTHTPAHSTRSITHARQHGQQGRAQVANITLSTPGAALTSRSSISKCGSRMMSKWSHSKDARVW